ncbi:LETM1-related biofilm-associated protein [Aquimarina sp. W85]|uniref:LETM1-related biofilm-associated protein n=1 Tax=Aquimarina rhodophyticola TaxID=3342246 RepID=UPI00366D7ED1
MNPSASGWLDKFLREFTEEKKLLFSDMDVLYEALLASGFLYGASVTTLMFDDSSIVYSEEERTKINLLTGLVGMYYDTIEGGTSKDCIDALLQFYNYLNTKKSIFPWTTLLTSTKSEKLEKIIHARIQTNESVVFKNFSHLLTNALLFIDVLAFEHFLVHDKNPIVYATKLEESITNTVFLALKSKSQKDEYDGLLIKLFSSSVRYNQVSEDDVTFDNIDLHNYTDELEKRYILDLTSLAVWNDHELDTSEKDFLLTLGVELDIPPAVTHASLKKVKAFIQNNRKEISFFNYSNPAHHFYRQTSRTVRVLILRNKKRLVKEISESKDLMILLGQSTIRDLSKDEKQRVKEQLLDICKSVPSLTIFILPGGSLLLPLLIKFIPQLLPSAFNENK